MSINFKTKKKFQTKPKKQELGFRIIFFALNGLLVPFSAIATYKGYRGFLEDYQAIILALTTGVLFFGLNYLIMERRSKGENHVIQALGFLVPLLISFFGNFTHFYGDQMEATILDRDLVKHKTTLTQTYADAKNGLTQIKLKKIDSVKSKNELAEFSTILKSELALLKNESEDVKCGKLCLQKWKDIQSLFKTYYENHNLANPPLKNLPRPSDRNFTRFRKDAEGALNALERGQAQEIKQVETLINTKVKELDATDYAKLVKEAESLTEKDNEEQLKSKGVNLIKNIIATNNNLGQKASSIEGFKFQKLAPYDGGVNSKSIKSVLNSAFVKGDNNSATIFSFIISLVIDLATLGFVFLAISFNQKQHIKRRGPINLDERHDLKRQTDH